MNGSQLEKTAQSMVAAGKGILAADQGASFVEGWLESSGQPTTPNTLVQYREMLFRTPRLCDYISGIILLGEVVEQRAADGTPLLDLIIQQGILPGVTPSTGLQPLAGAPDEVITAGLDGLRERLATLSNQGFRFTKWRSPLTLGPGLPTEYAADANAYTLGQFAALSQEVGLVP